MPENTWYCDICGGFFQVEEIGFVSDETHICEECHERGFDRPDGTIH
jgi:hypothetical protein